MARKPALFGACLAVSMALPTIGNAQITAVCGSQDLLFHCTFDDGAKLVELCLSDQTISYSFGVNASQPELSLSAAISDVGYIPYGWASSTIFESVQLNNGNTSYEVFSSVARGDNPDPAKGGIIVTLPNQSRTILSCDAGSVLPQDPIDGIGQLAAFTADNGWQLLSRCLDASPDANACLGTVQRNDIAQDRCTLGPDDTDCWRGERAAWDIVLSTEFQTAFDVVLELQGDAFANTLRTAQDSWQQTRDLDCQVYWPLLFAADGGQARCHATYAAKRVAFLRYVAGVADFQG